MLPLVVLQVLLQLCCIRALRLRQRHLLLLCVRCFMEDYQDNNVVIMLFLSLTCPVRLTTEWQV